MPQEDQLAQVSDPLIALLRTRLEPFQRKGPGKYSPRPVSPSGKSIVQWAGEHGVGGQAGVLASACVCVCVHIYRALLRGPV